jgi:hypothetical protein
MNSLNDLSTGTRGCTPTANRGPETWHTRNSSTRNLASTHFAVSTKKKYQTKMLTLERSGSHERRVGAPILPLYIPPLHGLNVETHAGFRRWSPGPSVITTTVRIWLFSPALAEGARVSRSRVLAIPRAAYPIDDHSMSSRRRGYAVFRVYHSLNRHQPRPSCCLSTLFLSTCLYG